MNTVLRSLETQCQKIRADLKSAPRDFFQQVGVLVSGFGQGHIHQMLAQEPYLQFIGPQNIADGKIVGSIVT